MDELTLFTNYTPNTDKGLYVFPKEDYADHRAALLTYYKNQQDDAAPAIVLNALTFNVYEDYIDIPDDNPRYYNITYLALKHNDFIMFYYVNRIQIVSQGIRLFTQLDLWGTYIGSAKIKNLHFTRTNIQLSLNQEITYLTEKEHPNNAAVLSFYHMGIPNRVKLSDIGVIATIKHKTYNNPDTQIEEIHSYLFDPSELQLSIRNVLQYVASIYEVTNTEGNKEVKGSAEVIKIFIYPKQFPALIKTYSFRGIINGEQYTATANILDSTIVDYVYPIYNADINFSPLQSLNEYSFVGSLKKKAYFGTKYNGIELPPFVGLYNVSIKTEIDDDGLTVTVSNGQDTRDITQSFEVPAVANSGTLTSQERATKWLGIIAGVGSGIFQIASGGAGIVSGGLSIAQTINSLFDERNGTYIGNGNGWATFKDIYENGEGEYLFVSVNGGTADGSLNDEAIKDIQFNGAICDYVYPDTNKELFNIINSNSPRQKYLIDETLNPFIACYAAVLNIPQEAINEIATQLESGVRLDLY